MRDQAVTYALLSGQRFTVAPEPPSGEVLRLTADKDGTFVVSGPSVIVAISGPVWALPGPNGGFVACCDNCSERSKELAGRPVAQWARVHRCQPRPVASAVFPAR